MSNAVKCGLSLAGDMVPLKAILRGKPPRDRGPAGPGGTPAIRASIKEIGVIGPPVVYPLLGPAKQYLLLGGHLRLQILEKLGATEVFCLVATDDEAYTCNHKVSRLTQIQEYRQALERGMSEERTARALQVEIPRLRDKGSPLNGICDEAVDLLKDAPIGARLLRYLRRVKPARQVEIAKMMLLTNTFGEPYMQALIAATPKEQRQLPAGSHRRHGRSKPWEQIQKGVSDV